MKTFKMFITASVLFLGMSIANAQSATPEVRANAYTVALTTVLSLTADQVVKMEEINLGIAMKNDGIRSSTNFSEEQKSDILISNNAARLERYGWFLSPTQMQALQVYEAEMAANGESNNL
ncbi:MAG: hypothetical protein ACK49D_11670 [Flavobacteriia bacterium]|jgi:hypothetical protein|nr:hypothetical protein [Cryomorphaceae bacterium]